MDRGVDRLASDEYFFGDAPQIVWSSARVAPPSNCSLSLWHHCHNWRPNGHDGVQGHQIDDGFAVMDGRHVFITKTQQRADAGVHAARPLVSLGHALLALFADPCLADYDRAQDRCFTIGSWQATSMRRSLIGVTSHYSTRPHPIFSSVPPARLLLTVPRARRMGDGRSRRPPGLPTRGETPEATDAPTGKASIASPHGLLRRAVRDRNPETPRCGSNTQRHAGGCNDVTSDLITCIVSTQEYPPAALRSCIS